MPSSPIRPIVRIKRAIAMIPGARKLKHLLLGPGIHRAQRSAGERRERVQVGRPLDRGLLTASDRERLAANYRESPLSREPDSFVLYRIIGNDLYPRHAEGQSRKNVSFILEHEPALDNCEKHWIVNRIFDPDEESRIMELLDRHSQPYIRIPFDSDEYRNIGWDFSVFRSPDYLHSRDFQRLDPEVKSRAVAALYRLKNNYVMNNNGARNVALRDAKNRAKWALPWDGNCFLTATAWMQIRNSISENPYYKYFTVPMQRMTNNEHLLRKDLVIDPVEEPQIIFRKDSREEFNEDYSYGRRPKVELLWRLGVHGPWDSWKDDPWDMPRTALSDDAYQFGTAGWVARMFCGSEASARQDKIGSNHRYKARQQSIITTIDEIDKIVRKKRLAQ